MQQIAGRALTEPDEIATRGAGGGHAAGRARLTVGAAGALALSRVPGSLLYEIAPVDATTCLGATLLLAIAAMFSCWLPAQRATRLDVVAALQRTERSRGSLSERTPTLPYAAPAAPRAHCYG